MSFMTELTLVVPFALPPPELAADLVRALEAPHLAALLSRSAAFTRTAHDDAARALPHEAWLAGALGLQDGDQTAFAAAVMRGFRLDPGLDPGNGGWLIVHPAHIEITRTHLLMTDLRRLGLVESQSRALFDSAKPYFDEDGHELLYGDASTWFMRAGDWGSLVTTSPDATGGMNLTDCLPLGERALAYRKLQNEVQMLWHSHPANAEREARGLASINGFWPWGAAAGSRAATMPVASAAAPAWLAALGETVHGPFAQWLQRPARPTVFVEDALTESSLAADWATWLVQMRRIDAELLSPLLGAVKGGMKAQLVLSHRTALVEVSASAMAQRSFWRSHSLARLLPAS